MKIIGVGIFSLALVLGIWSYSQATGNEITICAKKSGLVYVIGDGFRRADCKKNDQLLTWNVVGIKGDKGDKGDTGDVGPRGPIGETGPQGLKGDKGDSGNLEELGPQAKKVTLFVNKCGGWVGEYSQIMDTTEYSRISIHSNQASATYALHYSNDGVNWHDQGPLFTSTTTPQDYFVLGSKYRMDLRTVDECTSFTAYLLPW
ncbi:hypothetical protein A2641_00795 [Candidatus Nomurabacteria bacterium RIFCSPHIGHO2_01_FULL_37_25]|uniref:Uncharacterized protein n=1 Tax=Candidatus Nomurabacteria bacterium RIFCSPLOWO2_01_FULL_36_16 TaxID=1801767 RepID=A0A1F6WXP4_9BACT|nr:MAG: hypothetical protein A2641_00795 [Candidatus Nomurabacteria bacterium RIFCSPHIGHO2_01_FULL_37_25]OGI74934.1 MAG: hypothetical protein A3D36_01400 [Candidatus Nomurabacteria bacterium RIFCSPHIGHO2_02_FULL_36_29]OGI86648.1 MAG: hypothetical protein A3A91_02965 [Candidatus Nomurabacteria bacterium RIFCSPLOWO2_01_FULL_36_16]